MSELLPQAPKDALAEVARLVEAHAGLRFVGGRRSELANKAARAFANSGCPTWETYLASLAWPHVSPMLEQLVRTLTVGETYFFRHRAYFELLERDVLPRIVAERQETRRLRIWSAGCATGEEAYSLAILLWRSLPDLETWDVSILGTDLNTGYLARAREGQYSAWSLRGADEIFTSAYFSPDGQQHRIKPSIARLVRFAQLNLAEPTYPSPANATSQLDLIFCRNVLMYLAPEVAKSVVKRLRAALVPNGWLIVGPSDPVPGLLTGFEPHGDTDAIAYQRIESPTGTVPVPQPAAAPPTNAPTSATTPDATTTPRRAPGRAAAGRVSQARLLPKLQARSRRRGDAATGRRRAPTTVSAHPPGRTTSARMPATDDPDWLALWQAARAATADGDLERTEAFCRQAAERWEPRAEPYYLLGVLRQASGDDPAALVEFRKALYLDRTFVPALLAVATIYRRGGHQQRAQRALERAQRLLVDRADDEPILAEEPSTVGRLRDVLSRALGTDAGGAA